MPSIYQLRRPRASPLWQLLTAAWESFLASYETKHRPTLGPLRPNVFTAVRMTKGQAFYQSFCVTFSSASVDLPHA